MATAGLRPLAVSRIIERREDAVTRFSDLQLSLVHKPNDGGEHRVILTTGGVWDSREHCYARDDEGQPRSAETERVLYIHDGQVEAAEWCAEWLTRYATGDWNGYDRAYSSLWLGGRRAGKTWLACAGLLFYTLLVPGCELWAISPSQKKTRELMKRLGNPNGEISSLMPLSWHRFISHHKIYGPHFRLRNGSRILLKTGQVSQREGDCHMALYNEGAEMSEAGFVEVRAATADHGGLTIVTANPPNKAIGEWIETFADDCVRGSKVAPDGTEGKRAATFFQFDRRLNPYAEQASIEALKFETDEITYARDGLGLLVPLGDKAIFAFSKRESIRAPCPGLVDITRKVTKKHCKLAADYLIGMDFDKVPHLAASISRFYADPRDPSIVLMFVEWECYAVESDEQGLCNALLATELDGAYLHQRNCVVVGDASGSWQDVEKRKGRDSFQIVKARGFRIIKPDPKAEGNPKRIDRFKVTNAAFRNAAGVRQVFIHPRCRQLIIDHAGLERIRNEPNPRSRHAHGVDSVSYPLYRVFHHKRKPGHLQYQGRKPHPFVSGLTTW